jgi:hypothetical protein
MSTTQISCTISASDPAAELGVEVWMDSIQIYNSDHFSVAEHQLTWDIDDQTEGEHTVRFVLKNKKQHHTTVDSQGNIITDATIAISNLAFDGIELNQLFFDHAKYCHNLNGTSLTDIDDRFYGVMGCNGTVSLTFTAPAYIWLLKNM